MTKRRFLLGMLLGGAPVFLFGCTASDDDRSSGSDGDADGDTDGDADGGSDGDGDADGDTDTLSCAENDFQISLQPVDMLIVLDRSSSMRDKGLWTPMCQAITEITAELEDEMNFGLMTLPEIGCGASTDECQHSANSLVPLGDVDAVQRIASALGPAGIGVCEASGTPTAATLAVALDELEALANGNKHYVLLATDGAPNCNESLSCATCTVVHDLGCGGPTHCLDDVATEAAAEALFDAGYPVYVVGLGDLAKWWTVMDGIAEKGGTIKAHSAEDPAKVADVLKQIAGEVASCDFDVSWSALPVGASKDPALVNLYCKESAADEIGPDNIVKLDAACGAATGWEWSDDDTIHLCQAACGKLRAGGCAEVTATFGCTSVAVK